MEYRPFGQTGLEVSTIGFGCWEIGGGYGEVDLARVVEGSAIRQPLADVVEPEGHNVAHLLARRLDTRAFTQAERERCCCLRGMMSIPQRGLAADMKGNVSLV